MVRGRRTRANIATAPAPSIVNGGQLVDDQYCASPKRKDCKIDDVTNNINKALQAAITAYPTRTTRKQTNEISNYEIFGAKTRSQKINQYFSTEKISRQSPNGLDEIFTNGDTIGAELEVQTTSSSSLDPCDDIRETNFGCYNIETNNSNAFETNIFLQEPVLSLNVDKSPNQASSIKINKTLEVEPIFNGNVGTNGSCNVFNSQILNGQFNKIVTLSNSPKQDTESTAYILLNSDSNSCDSGVVIDKQLELSPNRRRKPTTPHRILCPSPVKHAIVEKSPSSALSHLTLINAAGYANGVQKRNPKSRRRLNATQSENNSSMTSPQLVGGVTLSETLKQINVNNNVSQKSILNSAKNPTAEQNTNNNYKLTQQKHRNNGHHQSREKNLNQQQQQTTKSQNPVPPDSTNKKLTDFFPVRRSVRRTKKAVQEEMMRSIEKAIIEGREDSLKVENFEGKGRGIVADRLFKRGEFVVEYIGDLITINEANQREIKYSLDENAGCYMYYFKHRNQQYCIDATSESGKLGRLVNHSRNGNLITKVVVVKNHPHLVLIAKDDIQPGEELTYDYGDRSKESLMHHPWLAL